MAFTYSTDNPFELGPVQENEHFIGREEARAYFERMIEQGMRTPTALQNFVIVGKRGMGKTSLLRYMLRFLVSAPQELLVIHTSASDLGESSFIDYLHFCTQELLDYAQQKNLFPSVPNFYLTYKSALGNLSSTDSGNLVELNVLDFPVWYFGYVNAARTARLGGGPVREWRHDLAVILKEAQHKGLRGCVLALDNADDMESSDLTSLIRTISASDSTVEGCPVLFIVTGGDHLKHIVEQQQSRNAVMFELQPFDLDAVYEYLHRTELHTHGMIVTHERAQEYWEMTRGVPSLLARL